MTAKLKLPALCPLLSALCFSASGQGTAFTYQGRLNNNGSPASGTYDFRFRLAADPLGNTYVGNPYLTNAIAVNSGLFTTTMDFGPGVFAGSNYWLEVDVRTNGAASYTALTPLQALTPTPYAVFANSASNILGGLSASQITSGILPQSVLPGFFGANGYNSLMGGSGNLQYGGSYSAIVGGRGNILEGIFYNAIVGGEFNLVSSTSGGFIGGGSYNNVAGLNGVVSGGTYNTNAADYSFIGGGYGNSISPFSGESVISGGNGNTINPSAGATTIGGGAINVASGGASTIAGGQQNQAFLDFSTVGGGYANQVSNYYAFVGGGYENLANGSYAVATGGQNNTNTSQSGTIAGGQQNLANGQYQSTVGGGYNNTASANYATVPGGFQNIASGSVSFAAGQQAQALHQGAFVWADSQGTVFPSTANNQFLVRAQGGMGINMNNPNGASLYVQGNRTNGWPSSVGWFENTSTASNNAPALRVVVDGGNPNDGALSVSANIGTGTRGIIAEFGNSSSYVALITNNGTIYAPGFVGNGTNLTSLNASQLTGGTVPLSRLPAAVVTNFENGATLSNLTLSGTLNFPQYDYYAVTPLTIFAGTNLLLRTGLQGSFYFGPNAGNTNSFAAQNAGFGAYALNAVTVGGDDAAFGWSALMSNTSGNANTAVGTAALEYNTTGGDNTASGFAALGGNVTGSRNVAIGSQALEFLGFYSAGGSNNIALGYAAGSVFTNNESGNIDIGNVGVLGENNTIRIGTPGSHTGAFIAGVVTDVGGVQVGTNGTTMSLVQSGQAIMPSSSLQATNFTITFPHAFTVAPKVIASLSGDPGYPTAGDTFAMSIRAITTTTGFTINVFRVDQAGGWAQQLRVNWQAWQ